MEVIPLHPDFAAEIRGLDLARALGSADAAALVAALDRFQLLVLPQGGPLNPEHQVALVRLFGAPLDNGGGQDDRRLWSVLNNAEDAGAMVLPFHCDFSYTDAPLAVISLMALQLPSTGTTTSFVSNVACWAALPEALRRQLAPMHIRHHHVSRLPGDWPEFTAIHPLAKPHPRTGEPMLFVTEYHGSRILELNEGESAAMLARLCAHLYAEAHVYTHHWGAHDLLIWDNRAVQHARGERADPDAGARVVRRVVTGEAGFAELLERARQRQRQTAVG